MDNNKAYRIVSCGKKSSRRDYSKVSGKLELPNLVEIQTDSFKWFTQQGIQEVFEEIYPIENYGKNIRLNFLRYHFEEPKYNAEESMYRECNFAATIKNKKISHMILSFTGKQTVDKASADIDISIELSIKKLNKINFPNDLDSYTKETAED